MDLVQGTISRWTFTKARYAVGKQFELSSFFRSKTNSPVAYDAGKATAKEAKSQVHCEDEHRIQPIHIPVRFNHDLRYWPIFLLP